MNKLITHKAIATFNDKTRQARKKKSDFWQELTIITGFLILFMIAIETFIYLITLTAR